MPLELRPNCECCDRDLPPSSKDAVICTFECTFCTTCAADILGWVCPNCCGNLVAPLRHSDEPFAWNRHEHVIVLTHVLSKEFAMIGCDCGFQICQVRPVGGR
jgi:uncharacterized protein